MPHRQHTSAPLCHLLVRGCIWGARLVPLAVTIGLVCAFFLYALDQVTLLRMHFPWLLYLLPVAGLLMAFVYSRYGSTSAGGNNLIIEQIHTSGGGVPKRMAPLILLATLITHLFGGSAGREGTAVQMGGSIATSMATLFKMENRDVRVMLMAGIAGGFGAVFGTPLAGTIFAMEVLVIGRLDIRSLLPCLLTAVVADKTVALSGIHHSTAQVSSLLPSATIGSLALPAFEPLLFAKIALAGVLFGLTSILFVELQHAIQHLGKKIHRPLLRPVAGGLAVIGLVWLVGSSDYLGIGTIPADPGSVTIASSFTVGGSEPFSWFWKLLFTATTLGSGFKGGEVTPLFFIGSTLGNSLSVLFGSIDHLDLFAAMGFLAVFAAASNTPLACIVMGVELFGSSCLFYSIVACYIAYFFSGHTGIYLSQNLHQGDTGTTLRGARRDRLTTPIQFFLPLHRFKRHR